MQDTGTCAFGSARPLKRPRCKTASLLLGTLPHEKARCNATGFELLAEDVGFEPTRAFTLLVFKTSAFNHSAIPPKRIAGYHNLSPPLGAVRKTQYRRQAETNMAADVRSIHI